MTNRLAIRASTAIEVQATVAAIAAAAATSIGSMTVVDCMQPHRAAYYQDLAAEFGVKVFLYGRNGSAKAALVGMALGHPALLVVDRSEVLPSLVQRVGEQALVGIYVVQGSVFQPALEQLNYSDIRSLVLSDSTHLVYQIDEDSAEADGRITEMLSAGSDCPESLRKALRPFVATE
jgi:hypothetical protein